jgi:hypothetical protein
MLIYERLTSAVLMGMRLYYSSLDLSELGTL